mmetsp:Transcript_20839/g.43422  ORF Transcript_20839/g.43422 Transcript_20839/m.43422 type:complete len:84 (+) Transcript_20839:244-495(+)
MNSSSKEREIRLIKLDLDDLDDGWVETLINEKKLDCSCCLVFVVELRRLMKTSYADGILYVLYVYLKCNLGLGGLSATASMDQ